MKKAVFYMAFASLLFSIMGVFVKKISQSGIPSVEIVFFRSVFSVFFILILIKRKPLEQIGGKFPLLAFRGLLGFLGLLTFFYNIVNIPLAEAMTFSRTSPIFTAIFASLFIKEKLTKKAWIYIFIGFIGITFITQPKDLIYLDRMDFIGILSGLIAGGAYTTIRVLKQYYDIRIIVLSFALTATIGSMILMFGANFIDILYLDFAFKKFIMPHKRVWIYIFLLGILSTMAQIYMTKAYTLAKGGIIGTVSYINIVFSLIIGLTFLGEAIPNYLTIIGIVLIVLSGIKIVQEK